MYEERTNRVSFKDVLLQLLFIILFVFVLLWLFPTKGYLDKKLESQYGKLEPLYARIFNDNILTMKDAAKSYFTDPRLPKNVGDKVSKTLREMQDLNLILPFTDSNGNQCDLDNSYVEITKMEDEYIMKVNLSCKDQKAYIVEHMGCYTYCETAICEKQEETTPTVTPTQKPTVKPTVTKKYQYQYVKQTGCTLGNWGSWSEWTTNKATATDYLQVETKTEKEFSHYDQVWGVVKTEVKPVKSYVDKEITVYVDKEVTETVEKEVTTYETREVTTYETKQVQTGTKKVAVGTKTVTSGYVTSSSPSSYTWVDAGTVTTSRIPTNTTSTKYSNCVASVSQSLSCTDTCKVVNHYTYRCSVSKLQSSGGGTTKTCESGYTNTGSGCSKEVTVYEEVPVYETQTVPVTKTERVPVTKTVTEEVTKVIKVPETKVVKVETVNYETVEVYGWVNGEAIYNDVTYYRTRTRSCTGGSVDYKWSNSQNDTTLINQGYTLTGKVQEI